EAGNGCPHIADAVTRNGCGKPVAFIAPKQELVFFGSFANHQHQVMRTRLHIKHLDDNLALAPDDEDLAGALPADINCNLRPLETAGSAHNDARTHAGEVATQIILGRHTSLSVVQGCRYARRRKAEKEPSCAVPVTQLRNRWMMCMDVSFPRRK